MTSLCTWNCLTSTYLLFAETNQDSKKKVRCDDVFSNMSAPEMATYIKPVVYQDTPLPAVSSPEANKPTAQAKKVSQLSNNMSSAPALNSEMCCSNY